MRRPNLHSCSRAEATRYIEYLEDQVQRQLDFGPVLSRNTDPGTSHKAAFDVFPKMGTRRHTILHALARAGDRGLTQDEAAAETGIVGVWKRLSELYLGGWADRQDTRTGTLSGAEQHVYTITDRGMIAISREAA